MLRRNRRREIDARHGLGPYRRPLIQGEDLDEAHRIMRGEYEMRTHTGELNRMGGYQEDWRAHEDREGRLRALEIRREEEEEQDKLQELLGAPNRYIRERICEHYNGAKLNDGQWNHRAQHMIEMYWKTYDTILDLTTSAAMIQAANERVASTIHLLSRQSWDILASAHYYGAWDDLKHLVRPEGDKDPLTDNESETSTEQNAREYYPGRERVEDGVDSVTLQETSLGRRLSDPGDVIEEYVRENL